MKKRIVLLLLLAVCIAAGYFGKKQLYDNPQQANGSVNTIYGYVEIRDAELAFSEQERLAEVLVEEGQMVKKDQIVARLNPDRLQTAIVEATAQIAAQQEIVNRLQSGYRPQKIAQAQAEVEASKARIENTRQALTRLGRTAKTGATSQQDLDDTKAALAVEKALYKVKQKALALVEEGPRQEDIAAAKYQLQALQAKLELLHIRLADMTLKAPTDGTIQSRILEPGEMAGPSRPVFTLALTKTKWVRAYVPEPMLGRVRPGMEVDIISDSFPDTPVSGRIGFIASIAEFTPRTVQTEDLRTRLVYETRVNVDDPDDRLRLGMPVSVKWDMASHEM